MGHKPINDNSSVSIPCNHLALLVKLKQQLILLAVAQRGDGIGSLLHSVHKRRAAGREQILDIPAANAAFGGAGEEQAAHGVDVEAADLAEVADVRLARAIGVVAQTGQIADPELRRVRVLRQEHLHVLLRVRDVQEVVRLLVVDLQNRGQARVDLDDLQLLNVLQLRNHENLVAGCDEQLVRVQAQEQLHHALDRQRHLRERLQVDVERDVRALVDLDSEAQLENCECSTGGNQVHLSQLR